jgi:cell division protein FtsL
MANRIYAYQYETSPRKLKPEYERQKKKTSNKKEPSKQVTHKNTSAKKTSKKQVNKKTSKEDLKKQKNLEFKTKFSMCIKCVLLFAILFLILFRNSQISESFSKIQSLKTDITALQKENDQLEISIQNSLNLNKIEQSAKELLGMQKLTSKQIVYITLPKKDYVEHRTEEVIVEEEKGFFESLLDKIKSIF